jgi:hypothetical protein
MKYLLIPIAALSIGTAALAQSPAPEKSYPPCSKSVKDECISSAGLPGKATAAKSKKAAHHARHHHHAKATETAKAK